MSHEATAGSCQLIHLTTSVDLIVAIALVLLLGSGDPKDLDGLTDHFGISYEQRKLVSLLGHAALLQVGAPEGS